MRRAPLDGLMVLDFTQHLAGPFATMILRDLGARVIKFEPPQGDPARRTGPFQNGDSAYFHPINRGKESVVIDLKRPEDVQAVRRLLPYADCLVENFRPGVMDTLGVGHEEALRANPRLIYAACSGFGRGGPYASRGAFDVVVQAMGGVMSLTGEPDGSPTRTGISQGDLVAGVYTAMAVLAGVVDRAVTGRGGFVDVSMLEAQMSLATHAFGIWAATGANPPRIGNRHPAAAPFDVFRTNDGYVAIAAVGNDAFARMCDALGLDAVRNDERFASGAGRLEHVDALTAAITESVRRMSTDAVVEKLVEASVVCGAVLMIGDLANDAHVEARGSLLSVSPWGENGLPVPALPFLIDGHRWAVQTPGPELGSCSLERLEAEMSGNA